MQLLWIVTRFRSSMKINKKLLCRDGIVQGGELLRYGNRNMWILHVGVDFTRTEKLTALCVCVFLKLGKGLLQDEKAQKLALHHWLEAVSPHSIHVLIEKNN